MKSAALFTARAVVYKPVLENYHKVLARRHWFGFSNSLRAWLRSVLSVVALVFMLAPSQLCVCFG